MDKVAAYAVSQMPPQRVLIGLAFYGYDWNTTLGGKARALIYSQSVALAKQHGTQIATDGASRSGTFSYTAKPGDTVPPPPALLALQHDIQVRTPLAPCKVQSPVPTPVPSMIKFRISQLSASTSMTGACAAAGSVDGSAVWSWTSSSAATSSAATAG